MDSSSSSSSNVFTGAELVRAVELMISKRDLRSQPALCGAMLDHFGFTAKDIRDTLREGKYIDFTRRGALGLVPVK